MNGSVQFLVCERCDADAIKRKTDSTLSERRIASGWTQRLGLHDRLVWSEAPAAAGWPGRVTWQKPSLPTYVSPEEEQRRDALRAAEYGEADVDTVTLYEEREGYDYVLGRDRW